MAKKIIIRIRKVLTAILSLSFVILLGIKVVAAAAGYGFDVSSLLYWLLFLLVAVISTYNFSGGLIFPVGLLLYFLGSLLSVFTFKETSEVLLKASILFFLVGIIRAFFEYKIRVKIR